MTVKTFDKNGEQNNVCWRNVQKIKIMFIPAWSYDQSLLELHLTFEDGQEAGVYLSEHERFAIIEQE